LVTAMVTELEDSGTLFLPSDMCDNLNS
jgi:hypothetical protein